MGRKLVAEDEKRTVKNVSRRVVLTLGGLTAGAVIYGQFTDSSSEPAPEPSTTPTPRPEPKSVLVNRDPSVTKPLQRTRNTSGARRLYAGAFPATKIRRVVPLPGLKKSEIPWLAVSIVGPTHQLQIINPNQNSPAHVVEIPHSHNGGVQTMAWDKKNKKLYLGTRNYLLVWMPSRPSKVTQLGQVAGASTIYDLQIDSLGTVWGGTYPLGAAFRYTPDTKKFKVFERVSADTDYVRRVAVDANDNVWLGTGSRNPRVFRFSAKSPQKVLEIPLREPKSTGFISSLQAVEGRIVVSADNVSGQLLLNPQNNSWVGTVDRVWSGRKVSAVIPDSNQFYNVSDNQLYATSSSTWDEQAISKLSGGSPLSIYATDTQVVVVSANKTGLQIEVVRLSSRSVQLVSTVALARGEFVVQSLMAHSDGNIYVGGYMGHGVTSINPKTGKHWTSPVEQNSVNQIEGMIEFDAQKTYIGSYGSADIVRLTSKAKDKPEGYSRITRLATDYEQSRIFAWAKNSKTVFFGTVPEYGRSGGVLGAINPQLDEISWVLDGGDQGFVPKHSITGLVADEKFIYGTTSVRNGYGLADTRGNAKVFKVDIATRKILWSVSPIAKCGAVYAPKLMAGWLLVADLEGVAVLDPRNGKLIKKHQLTNARNTSYRPGWKNADLVVLESVGKAVHTAAGTTTVVDFAAATRALIGSPQLKSQFGTRLTVSSSGQVFANAEKTAIAELDLQPIASQSKTARPSATKAAPTATATT